MARIRTIKPDFFTSESIVAISPLARLLFIATWLEADREGRLVWRPRTLKLRYLPGDKCDVERLGTELVQASLINLYVVNGQVYAEIPGFARHQVINNRESPSRIPAHPGHGGEGTRPARVTDASMTPLAGREGTERNGGNCVSDVEPDAQGDGASDKSCAHAGQALQVQTCDCPHQEILDLYHRYLPSLPEVRAWNSTRRELLEARWNADPARQRIDWWERFFVYIAERCPFLVGQAQGGSTFRASLEWILNEEKFLRIIEGAYEDRSV